jgi:hypothetical protein
MEVSFRANPMSAANFAGQCSLTLSITLTVKMKRDCADTLTQVRVLRLHFTLNASEGMIAGTLVLDGGRLVNPI